MIKHCKKRAKKERRSVNWVVNDIIRQDSENALPAAAGVAAR